MNVCFENLKAHSKYICLLNAGIHLISRIILCILYSEKQTNFLIKLKTSICIKLIYIKDPANVTAKSAYIYR